MNTYCPAEADFVSIEERVKEGNKNIVATGDDSAGLTIDATNLAEANTLAICALIEWRREALRVNCRLFFVNIPSRLKKLIGVYQLDKLIYEGECKPIKIAPVAEAAKA